MEYLFYCSGGRTIFHQQRPKEGHQGARPRSANKPVQNKVGVLNNNNNNRQAPLQTGVRSQPVVRRISVVRTYFQFF